MILVTLGTQKQDFSRLLEYIENSNIKDEIIVQAGYTKFKSKKMKIFDFISYEKMEEYIQKADYIITHSGTGSVLTPLKKNKKVIVCARLSKYGEHVDDHQKQLVEILKDEGYVLELTEDNKLDDLIKTLKSFKPKKYVANTPNFINKLQNSINGKDKKADDDLVCSKFAKFIHHICYLLLFVFSLLTIHAVIDGQYNISFFAESIIYIILIFLYFKYFTKIITKIAKKYDIYIIGILCVLIRIVWIHSVTVEPKVDYLNFYNTAKHLVENNLSQQTELTRFLSVFPHVFGYASFISIFYKLFGITPLVSQYFNILLSLISMVIIFNIGKLVKDRQMGIAGAIIWTFLPSQIIFNSQVFSEPLYTTLLLFIVYLMIYLVKNLNKLSKTKMTILLILIGVLCGWGNTLRPIFLIFIIISFIYFMFLIKNCKIIKRFVLFGIILLCYFVTITSLNHYTEYKIGREISNFPGYTIYVGLNTKSDGLFDADDWDVLMKYYTDNSLSASEVQNKMLEEAINRVKTEDINYLKLFLIQKQRSMWMGDDVCINALPIHKFYGMTDIGNYSIFVLMRKICNMYYLTLIVLCLFGLTKYHNNKYTTIFILYIIGLWLAHMLFSEVSLRYHYSAIAILVILSSYYISCILNKKNLKEK